MRAPDITRDPTAVTYLTDTDPTWYDPYYPDVWVPPASTANLPVTAQYWLAINW